MGIEKDRHDFRYVFLIANKLRILHEYKLEYQDAVLSTVTLYYNVDPLCLQYTPISSPK